MYRVQGFLANLACCVCVCGCSSECCAEFWEPCTCSRSSRCLSPSHPVTHFVRLHSRKFPPDSSPFFLPFRNEKFLGDNLLRIVAIFTACGDFISGFNCSVYQPVSCPQSTTPTPTHPNSHIHAESANFVCDNELR